jgi:outer membrane protein assembly factor BamC
VLALGAAAGRLLVVDGFLSGDKVDYRNQRGQDRPLEVPPDLTQLARDPRYAPQGGVISARPRRRRRPCSRAARR